MFNMDMAKKIIQELDVNKDGKIEYAEFEKFMKDGDNFVLLNEEDETSAANWKLSYTSILNRINFLHSKAADLD